MKRLFILLNILIAACTNVTNSNDVLEDKIFDANFRVSDDLHTKVDTFKIQRFEMISASEILKEKIADAEGKIRQLNSQIEQNKVMASMYKRIAEHGKLPGHDQEEIASMKKRLDLAEKDSATIQKVKIQIDSLKIVYADSISKDRYLVLAHIAKSSTKSKISHDYWLYVDKDYRIASLKWID